MLWFTWFLPTAWEGGEETKVVTCCDQGISASLLPFHIQTARTSISVWLQKNLLSLSSLFAGKGKQSSMVFLALFELVPTGL